KPFLPRTAETFYRAFNFEETKPWDRVAYADALRPLNQAGLHVTAPLTDGKPAPLFPKVEVKTERWLYLGGGGPPALQSSSLRLEGRQDAEVSPNRIDDPTGGMAVAVWAGAAGHRTVSLRIAEQAARLRDDRGRVEAHQPSDPCRDRLGTFA